MHSVLVNEPVTREGEERMGNREEEGIKSYLSIRDMKFIFDEHVDTGKGVDRERVYKSCSEVEEGDKVSIGVLYIDCRCFHHNK